MIAHGHAITAASTHRESLQEGWPLAGRTASAIAPVGLRILAEAALILFEVLPGNVASMGLRDQRGPLLTRQPFEDHPRLDGVALPAPAEKEGAGVARIMQNPQRPRVLQRDPERLAGVRTVARAAWNQELLVAERFHGRRRGSGPSKGLEEGADRVLDLLIKIQRHPAGGVIDEANGKRRFEFPTPRLVDDPAAEPRPPGAHAARLRSSCPSGRAATDH